MLVKNVEFSILSGPTPDVADIAPPDPFRVFPINLLGVSIRYEMIK